MSGTQNVGTFKHRFHHYIFIKMVLVLLHYKNYIFDKALLFARLLFGSEIYRQQVQPFARFSE
jgi:hypothetical protein